MLKCLPYYSKNWNYAFLVIAGLSLLLPLPFHFRHDYATYTSEWQQTLSGGDPWFYPDGSLTHNAYGPLFNLFAYVYQIYSHLPHLIYILSWLFLSRFTLNQFSESASEKEKKFLFFLLLLNPFFLGTVVSYGHFDIFAVLFSIGTVVLLQKNSEVKAGVSSGVAILLKFYPIFLVPFLSIHQRKIKWQFLLSTLLTVGFGMGLAYLVWGRSIFMPLTYAQDRQSTQLSIFRFLRSSLSPTGNLDFLAPYFLILGAGGFGLLHLYFRKSATHAAIVGFYLSLWFYRVGHFQFYTILFFLVPLWIAAERKNAEFVLPTPIKMALFAPLLFVSFSVLLYILTQGYKFRWSWVDEVISIPFFMIQCCSLPLLVRHYLSSENNPNNEFR